MPAIAALALVCMGGGTAIKHTQAEISGDLDLAVQGTRAQDYGDQVDVELSDSGGRIRLPRIVLPIAHGGSGGWFELKNLSVSDRVIEGSAAVNFINKPKVHIDRGTGTISITGKGGTYVGRCERVDTTAERKF